MQSALRSWGPLVLSLALVVWPTANAQIRQAKTILLIQDQASAPVVETFAKAFEAELNAKSAVPLDFYRESLDTVLIPDKDYQAEVRDWYERKYSKRKLDLVVALGPESHSFMEAEHDRFFPGVPVLFAIDIVPGQATGASNPISTGVWMDLDPVSTVNVARQLVPAAKHVVVIAGSGLFDKKMLQSVETKLQGYEGVDFVYMTDFDITSLLEQVHNLPKDTIVLYLSITADRKGHHLFVAYTLPLISSAASVPVFGLADGVVAHGAVGGSVTSIAEQTPIAADLALRLLQGEKTQALPPVVMPNRFVFDWKQMQRWGLDSSRLPPNSTFLNRQQSLWQQHERLIFAVLCVVLLQASLLAYLLIERRRRLFAQRALEQDAVARKRAEAALIDLSGRLIHAREEEQSRVARELHDDFNQRLAVMAMKLTTTSRSINGDPIASRRLDELSEETGDLAHDLQKLSHRLHSSVLDNLGLVDGLSDLCNEFTEQHEIEVVFTSGESPRELSPEATLCLFRIAQEGLNNIKKHSRATEAFIELDTEDEELVLSVIDKGIGFDDQDCSFKAGLGLRSMQERMRAVGGTINVESRRGVGTTISARIRISQG